MTTPYQVLGTSVPTLLGRAPLVRELERHLLKPSPDHVQVVGPTLFGKSVLLNGLAGRIDPDGKHYIAKAYLDLRHAPPADDESFRRCLATLTKTTLATARPELADYLDVRDPKLHELLDFVFSELEQQGLRVLMVLDGFDHVLSGTGITRNLWDQLRALAQKGSLRLVTGSRQPLRELCKTEESRASDFWEIFFETPLAIGPFGQDDWDAVLAPLSTAGWAIDPSARKEIVNWTGGVPVLAASLLQRLHQVPAAAGTLSKGHVDAAGEQMVAEPPAHLDELWEDCSYAVRADIATLAADDAGIPSADLSADRVKSLVSRGYAAPSGNRVKSACRIMARYAAQKGPATADLKRLFGSAADFDAHIRGVLELRLAQVMGKDTDGELRKYLESAVRDLDENPELPLRWVRSIASRAMTLIWDAELDPGRKIPQAWVTEWQRGERLQWMEPDRSLPRSQGAKCAVLRLMTGSDRVARQAKKITKTTSLLIDALQSVGDFGQHREDFPESTVTKAFAASVVLSAISLVESLGSDLGTTT